MAYKLSGLSMFVSWIAESSKFCFIGVIATSILYLYFFGSGLSWGAYCFGGLASISVPLFRVENYEIFCGIFSRVENCCWSYSCCICAIWGDAIIGNVWLKGDYNPLYLLFYIWSYLFFLKVEYPWYWRSITGTSGCLFISCSSKILEAFLIIKLACSGATGAAILL